MDLQPKKKSSNRKIKRKFYSVIWKHFDQISSGVVECRICRKKLCYDSSTTSMLRHMRSFHERSLIESENNSYTQSNEQGGVGEIAPNVQEKEFTDVSFEKDDASLKKNMRRRSLVWNHFVRVRGGNFVQCLRCERKQLSARGTSTTSMLRHLKTFHKHDLLNVDNADFSQQNVSIQEPEKEFAEVKQETIDLEDLEEKGDTQPVIKVRNLPQKHVSKRTKSIPNVKSSDNWSRFLIKYLATDLSPLSCLDKKSLPMILKRANPQCKIPKIDNLMTIHLSREVELAKSSIELMLSACTDCCLSTEIWRYRNQDMTTFFAHFVSFSYELKSYVVSTITGSDNESVSSITASIKSLSEQMKFSDKVFALISDGTSEDLKTATATSTYTHLTCFGHSLNTLILNAFNNVPEIKRLRAKVSKTVKYFNENVKSAQQLVLVQQQNNVPVAKLQEENSRNWLSIFEMFSLIIEQYEAINTVLCLQDNNDMCILDAEIETIREITDVSASFEYVSKELCSDKSNFLSIAIPLASLLAQNVSEQIETSQDIRLEFLNSLQTELEKHFSDIESNHVLAISTLLDPRFKRFAFQNQDAMEAAEEKMVEELHSLISCSESNKEDQQSQEPNSRIGSILWKNFEKRITLAGAVSNDLSNARNEANRYLKEPVIARNENPLEWWQLNQNQFPTVARLARKYLSLPVTAKRAELIFTSEAMEVEKQREALQPDVLIDMIFLNSYFSSCKN